MESEGRGRGEKWGMIMESQRGEEHGQMDSKEGREERNGDGERMIASVFILKTCIN